jgi:hypothetical protein
MVLRNILSLSSSKNGLCRRTPGRLTHPSPVFATGVVTTGARDLERPSSLMAQTLRPAGEGVEIEDKVREEKQRVERARAMIRAEPRSY